jgi:hypothetical protein
MAWFNSSTSTPAPAAADSKSVAQPEAGKDTTATANAASDTDKKSLSGLDAYAGLWDNNETPKQPEPPLNLAELVADGAALDKVAAQRNFLEGVDPAILNGLDHLGTDAKQALLAVANAAGQNAWKQALQAAGTLSQRGMDSRQESLDALVAGKVKEALEAHQLQTALPANQHPTVQMAIRGMANELRAQDPTLTPAQAAAKAKEFYTLVGKELLPAEGGGKQKPTDWNAWFNAKTSTA